MLTSILQNGDKFDNYGLMPILLASFKRLLEGSIIVPSLHFGANNGLIFRFARDQDYGNPVAT
jgi:hypothetical protein